MSYRVLEQDGQVVGVARDNPNVQIVGGISVDYQVYTDIIEKIDSVNDHYEIIENEGKKEVVEK